MVSSKCAVSCSKKTKLIKEQEVKGLVSMVSKTPFVGR